MSAPTILVVEDNPITRKMLRFALESEGYAVSEAGDGQTALALAEQRRPDAVLQDYVLPDMDGLQLIRSLRALPGLADIPVLVVTGMVSRLDALREYAGPRTNFLPKPVEPSRLLEVLRAHLAEGQQTPGSGRLVLVVDDEVLNLKLAMIRLGDAGFRVETAQGGEAALQQARRSVPDAILSDVLMPGLDGFLLCQAVRNDPRLAHVPVVLLSSSYVEAPDQELARDVGANALLPRNPDMQDAIAALVAGVSRGAAPTSARAEQVTALHSERVQSQLEKQLARNEALLRQGAIQAAALSVVRGLAEALANPSDLTGVLGDVLVHCLDATGLSTGLLYLPSPDGGLRMTAQAGLRPEARSDAAASFGHPEVLLGILDGREPFAYSTTMADHLTPDVRDFARRLGRASGLVIPLVVGKEGVGVLVLAADSQDLSEAAWRGFARALGLQFGQTIAVGRSLFRGAASEARYRTLMEEANDAIVLLDRDYTVLEANRAAETLVGRPRVDMVGRSYVEFLLPEDREDALRRRTELLTHGSLPVVERQLLRADGTSLAVEVSGSLVRTGEEPVVLAILRDITARKRAESHRATRYAITQVLAESATIGEAAPRLLQVLCERLGWVFGALWQANAEATTLRCHTVWHAPGEGLEEFAATTRRLVLEPGPAWPARVLTTGHHLWIRDAATETLLLRERAALAETAKLHAVCSFPIRAGHPFLGVLELFSHELRDADDEVSALISDIAEQVGQFWRRTLELNAAQERLRHVISSSPTVLYSLRVEGRTLVPDWVSPNIGTAIGYAVEEVVGEHWWWERVHPDDRGRLASDVAQLLEVGHIEREYRFCRKDQSYVWIRDEQRLLRDADGEPVEVVGSWWDVTDRMQAERRLQESEEQYRLLFESNPHPMWVYDPASLGFLEVNPAAVRLYGFSRAEFLGMSVLDIRAPEGASGPISDVETPRETHAGVSRHRKKDATKLYVDITSNPIDFRGKPARLVLAHDITAKRRLEAQLLQSQKMEAIGQLAGGVAHDFNNLLGVITGYTDLLRRDLGSEHKAQGRLEEVKKAAERAARLTRQLLAFSRQQVMQPRVLDANELVENLEKMLRRLIEENIELKAVLDPEAGRVKADPGQLEQVVMNLVVNARDAMPRGGRLTIAVKNARLDPSQRPGVAIPPGEYVALSISDTGVGMDKETQRHIFEPFFTTKEHGKGTGLGLATVYGIVKQSGGFIWVYSEPGLGTTFRIYLPRVEEPLSANEAPRRATLARGSETILVCEDEAALRAIVREGLEDHGYHVLEARTVDEALQISAEHVGPIHLLLSDVVMPGLTGRVLAEKVAAQRPGIRVLFASGYMQEAVAHHGLLDPGATLIQKPFSLEELARRVREVLERRDTAH